MARPRSSCGTTRRSPLNRRGPAVPRYHLLSALSRRWRRTSVPCGGQGRIRSGLPHRPVPASPLAPETNGAGSTGTAPLLRGPSAAAPRAWKTRARIGRGRTLRPEECQQLTRTAWICRRSQESGSIWMPFELTMKTRKVNVCTLLHTPVSTWAC